MIHGISRATQHELATTSAVRNQPVSKEASTQKSSASKPESTGSTAQDKVNISSAAQAAVQEAMETPAQTAQEARDGDHQAQRLLAKERASEKNEG
jgi:hypothetical protein